KTECQLVTPVKTIPGVLELVGTSIRFYGTNKFKVWEVCNLQEIYRRYYLLRNSAVEIFLEDQRSIFFYFPVNEVTKALDKLLAFAPNLINCASITPEKLITKITKKWQERRISNFEYLIALNTVAGRTFNDL